MAVLAIAATGAPAMATDVALSCTPGPMASPEAAEEICREFRDMLAETYPQHRFVAGDTPPAIALTVVRANDRGLGLAVTWIAADASRTTGEELSTTFFDKSSSPSMRRRFYDTFLRHNPLPF